ncbi:hypothetical protein F4781DRAFT_172321 [Annulohypoxylon bovei var. microspora]|nr:hypothetical protein F4781DRAFT_172321 [Annulohypoxylon bovei var. microspora]
MAMSAASGVFGYPPNFDAHTQGRQNEPPRPSYAAPSRIIENTQNAIDLYRSGQKLWMGYDLERVEYELVHYRTMPSFTIRRIDGSVVSIKNPMFGVSNPIWKPHVKFQHYWYLFKQTSENTLLGGAISPHSFPYYSYIIDWENRTYLDFVANEHTNLEFRFQQAKQRWEQSWSSGWLRDQLAALKGSRKITKVLCFGLGDMALRSRNDARTDFDTEDVFQDQKASLNQHAVALTIVAAFRAETSNDVEIFAQDPAYSETSKALLESVGVTIVGEHGAGGFSKIDCDSAVFFCYPAAPVRQIIADLARPALIIGNGDSHILNEDQTFPFSFDAESPRTREMWKEYTRHDFKIMQSDEEDLAGLRGLNIHVRNATRKNDCVDVASEKNAEMLIE